MTQSGHRGRKVLAFKPCMEPDPYEGHMQRRELIQLIASAAAGFWPLAVRAQQTIRMRRIGILLYAKEDKTTINPVLQGLEQLGYTDGNNIIIEYRDAGGQYDRLRGKKLPTIWCVLSQTSSFPLEASRLHL